MSQQVGPEDDCNWTYPGSNKNVPTIMVLRPTWDEFKDFNKYLKNIEDMGAYKGGIAKVPMFLVYKTVHYISKGYFTVEGLRRTKCFI